MSLIEENRRLEEIKKVLAVITAKMSIPLYLVFLITDYLYAPHLFVEFAAIRALIIGLTLIVRIHCKKISSLKSSLNIALTLVAINSIPITTMIWMIGDAATPYYAGLNLVALGAISFIPWTKKYLLYVVSLIYAPFLVTAPLFLSGKTEWIEFLINSFFVVGTITISLVISHFNELIRKQEFEAQLMLAEEIKSRDRVIQEKSEEAIKMSNLTKQFSPQVVHAITKGKLDIASLKRSKICSIFVDIVNSTERVTRIDKDDLNKVLSMFMSDTMKVLLKYDITIDKFLGDGVLAFSNAPLEQKDFIKRTVDAALEIRARIIANREEYLPLWMSELQVKIGIDVGFANVGFYGSEEYFKSYTSIGRVINLSSRLCSSAEPNQILVSNDVYKELKNDSYEFEEIGYKKIKGFESDIIKLYELKSGPVEIAEDIPVCPEGHGILHLDVNNDGIYVLKCRSCAFELNQYQNRDSDKKKKIA